MKERRRTFNREEWELERERFQIEDPVPPAPDNQAPPIGDLIPDTLRGMQLGNHAKVMQIADAWPELVGPQLASNTRPAHLEYGILTGFVRHPMWLMELNGPTGKEILSRVQEKFGKATIRSIRWSPDPDPPAQ